MALNISVELGRVERPAHLIAFQLRHVDAVGGKPAHRLVERCGHIAHLEDEAGNDRTVFRLGVVRFGRHDDEAGCVVCRVFHITFQNFQTINIGGQRRCQRTAGHVACFGNLAGGACRVGAHDGAQFHLGDQFAALAERHDMRLHALQATKGRALHAHELKTNGEEMLPYNIEPGAWKQMMDVRHPTRDRIFNRDHGKAGFTVFDGGKHFLKGVAGTLHHVGKGFLTGDVRIRTRFALKDDGVLSCGW